ncbi:MAG: hypothetical protein ACLSHC_17715 [Bilophila wadsworthia]
MRFSDETKEILKKVYKTWKGKTTYDRANKSREPRRQRGTAS